VYLKTLSDSALFWLALDKNHKQISLLPKFDGKNQMLLFYWTQCEYHIISAYNYSLTKLASSAKHIAFSVTTETCQNRLVLHSSNRNIAWFALAWGRAC